MDDNLDLGSSIKWLHPVNVTCLDSSVLPYLQVKTWDIKGYIWSSEFNHIPSFIDVKETEKIINSYRGI